MSLVYLGVGSNIDRQTNICAGLERLRGDFGLQRASSAYESAALGFEGPPFLNLAVELDTDLTLGELATALRELEYSMGRPAKASRFSSRTLDLDILTYDDLCGHFDGVVLPRQEILENAYVLAPLAELAPAARHPQLGERYDVLWERYDTSSQAVSRVAFEHGGWRLPCQVSR